MAKTKKPIIKEKPIWLKYTEDEVKAIILKLAEKGMTAEKIGLTLRDQYGIPKVRLYNMKIGRVLKQSQKFQEPGEINLNKKVENLLNHYGKNKQDKVSARSIIISKAKLKKQKDYLANKH